MRFLLLVILYFLAGISFCIAQPNASSNEADKVSSLLKTAKTFFEKGKYDSALFYCTNASDLSKMRNDKAGEAKAYDFYAEIMLATGKIDEVKKYNERMLPLALAIKDSALLANGYNRAGVYYMEKGQNELAQQNFNSALRFGLEKSGSIKTAEIYSNIASLSLAIGDKDKAMSGFIKALGIYEDKSNWSGIGETYSNISSVYYLMGKVDDAINFQNRSIEAREKINDRAGLVIAKTNIGQLYILKEAYPMALQHLQRAVEFAEELKNPKLMASAYSGMAAYASRTKNYTDALSWQTKAIKLFEEMNNKQLLSRLYVSAGNLANSTKDSISAIDFYTKALNISKELGNKENIGNAYEKMSNFYLSRNDFRKADENYRKFILYRDSITATSTLTKIEEIKTRYETEKKDNEIIKLNNTQKIKQLEIQKQKAVIAGNTAIALQKQNEIDILSQAQELRDIKIKQQGEQLEKQVLLAKTNSQQLQLTEKEKLLSEKQLKSQKLVRNLLIGGLGLIVLLGLTYFNRYQLKKKLEQQKNLLSIRNSISQDLHDDIGASLSNINILNELARRNMTNPEKSQEYLGKASEDIQRISESLADIVWNVNPKYDDLQNLYVRMKRYAADMLDGKNIKGTFDFPVNDTGLVLTMPQRRDLYLIFKEAVNNLAKYSAAENAVINVKADKENVSFLIQDDGKGFDKATVSNGNGLFNMQQRAKALGASIEINSSPGKGTKINLNMKVG